MTIELLAPARDAETGMAAVACGADAVYIGAGRFGARKGAENSLEDIRRLCVFAHRTRAKVYGTVNTLLTDEEIPRAVDLICRLYEIGVDAVIIQDAGLLECDLPPIPLFASTQMHNASPEKVRFLEAVGFQRVILARELDLAGIREIRKSTRVELEFFVHGALCVSYSGQCYLSYAIGGRSGNRGECAQPCRRPYRLMDAEGNILSGPRHFLSLKDLNLADHLEDLIDAGITSFKIEGRLKDAAYVMNIVSFYRRKLDRILQRRHLRRSSSGLTRMNFTPDPHKTFNRGYTPYFLTGSPRRPATLDTPKSMGEEMGRVLSVAKDHFITDSRAPFHRGDGLCFLDSDRKLCGTVVNRVSGRAVYPDKLKGISPGTLICRNHDHEFINGLKKSGAVRKISVVLRFFETDHGFRLMAEDEDGCRASADMLCEKQPALRKDRAEAVIRKQLTQSGSTPFICADLAVECREARFIPLSRLNALRREVLESLLEVRERRRPIQRKPLVRNSFPYPDPELSYQGNVLNRHARAFYERHGVTAIAPAAESGMNMTGEQVMRTRYCLHHQTGGCPGPGKNRPARAPLYLMDEDGRRFRLEFDCAACGMRIFRM